eukprot:scaffold132156_cov66-Phaeocystis_antarctica.AAC.4
MASSKPLTAHRSPLRLLTPPYNPLHGSCEVASFTLGYTYQAFTYHDQVASFTRGSSPRSFAKRAQHEEQRRLHRGDNQR